MSQSPTWSLPTAAPPARTPEYMAGILRTDLDAVLSQHSGSSRPSYAVEGTQWLDTSPAGNSPPDPWKLYLFDGAEDIEIAEIDPVTHAISWSGTGGGGGMSDLVEDTSPQLGGDLDLNGKGIAFPSVTINDVLDEDDMASDSATKVPTQQSVKAYADALFGGLSSVYQPLDGDLTAIAALTTTAPGLSVLELADPGVDRILAWDDSASAIAPIALADITTEGTPASGDFLLAMVAEGAFVKIAWDDLPGAGGGDSAAIHDNVAGEIFQITEKVSPVATDVLLIEDSQVSPPAKKRIQIGNLPAGGGGSAIILDLGDDGGNDSTDLAEIATSGDTNAIFTEPSSDKLLIDLTKNWPGADVADALSTDALDDIDEIASALKSGADATLVTGTAGTSGNIAQWNADGDLIDGGIALADILTTADEGTGNGLDADTVDGIHAAAFAQLADLASTSNGEGAALIGVEDAGDLFTATDVEAALAEAMAAIAAVEDDYLTSSDIVDEDNMASDSAALVPTQQSTKAYADTKAAKSANLSDLANVLTARANLLIVVVSETAYAGLTPDSDTIYLVTPDP